jgi:phosphoglycolate phosphatase-like HAD superfamily hydrolase
VAFQKFMAIPRLGLDFDGVLHDSLERACINANKVFADLSLSPITTNDIRRYITSDWTKYFDDLGVPREKHSLIRPLFKEYEKTSPLCPLVKDASWFINEAYSRYGEKNVLLVSNSQEPIVKDFFATHKISIDQIHIVSGSKGPILKELGITTYVGDIVSDGEAAIEARAKFVGMDHEPSFNDSNRLAKFKAANSSYPIFIATGLRDATNYI